MVNNYYWPTVFVFATVIWWAWRQVNWYIIDMKGYKWWFHKVYYFMPNWKLAKRVKIFIHGRKCQDCGTERGYIDCHHIHYRFLWWEWLMPWCLRLLCRECHKLEHVRLDAKRST